MVGPTTMRRVLNISALNCSISLLPPSISRKPITIIAPHTAINIKLMRVSGKLLYFIFSSLVVVASETFFYFFFKST